MKILLLMRHGKSSWKDKDLPDHERPLKKKGKKDSEKMAKMMKEKELIPGYILSSTAKRAKMTVEEVVDEIEYKGEVKYLDVLYQAEPSDYVNVLKEVSDEFDCVLIVGHNPSLEAFVQILSNDIEALPTAALARIDLAINSWKEMGSNSYGKLVGLWTPRDLEE